MTAVARLLEQRSVGELRLRMERDGIAVMQEQGSLKCRLPQGSQDAILINTSGGLAGGDRFSVMAEAGEGADLAVTSQAAERVYRTLGPAAEMRVRLKVARGAALFWLPQETIFFDRSRLERSLEVELDDDCSFLAVEAVVFGRREMGERVRDISLTDRWMIRKSGRLVHSESFRLGPTWSDSMATFADNHAAATIVFVAPEVERLLDQLRAVIGSQGGVSAWNGKLVARLLAKDGYALRKVLIQALSLCVGQRGLPKCWAF